MKICIVIPTYNEQENLRKLVKRIEDVLCKNKLLGYLIIVDDSSPDGTGELAKQLAKKYGNILVLHRPAKLGIGSAYREAFQIVSKHMDVNAVIEMDADLSHNPALIPAIYKKLNEGFDVVIASRYVTKGRVNNWSVQRYLISKGANLLAKLVTGIEVRDLTSGFRAYHTEALKRIELSAVRSDGYAFQVEMLHQCREADLKIAEVPMVFNRREGGFSKLDKQSLLEFIALMIRLLLNKRQRSRTL